MSDARLWLAVLAVLPALVIGASFIRLGVERLRRLAAGSAVAMLLVSLVVAISPAMRTFSIRSSALTWTPGGEAILRVDTLSAALLPLSAGLWLLTVAVTPRASLDRGGLRRTALATLITLASFLTESAVVLLLLSIAAVWTFLSALADPAHRYQRRIVAAYLGFSTLIFGVGVALLIAPGAQGTALEAAGMWLIVIAALVRKGIVPFHAWVPEVFDHGRLGPAILFSAPQVGAYMTVVLIVPRASPDLLRLIALLALGTAVYGAALALVQTSARRACGYLFMSQSALVMAGLDCTSASALAGGLLVWLSAGLAFAGLARCVLVLEARRGRLDLTTYHGGYERMPVLAISFLAMGLACTGFPGTLGFVGQELLVDGAVDAFPVMGFAVVIASALTGMAVLRMYFSLFCGRSEARSHGSLPLGLTRREAWTFVALVIAMVGLGIAPRRLVDSRFAASEDILRLRQVHMQGGRQISHSMDGHVPLARDIRRQGDGALFHSPEPPDALRVLETRSFPLNHHGAKKAGIMIPGVAHRRQFNNLTEQEVLALAISSEEDDARIYRWYAQSLRADYPQSARVLEEMAGEEDGHLASLIEEHRRRFGDTIPLVRREHVAGFYNRRPVWLIQNLGPERIRDEVTRMEIEAREFYHRAARRTSDAGTRQLLDRLAAVESGHEATWQTLLRERLPPSARAAEAAEAHRQFVLTWVQPGLAGLMDGSVSTLAPIFAAAFATGDTWQTFLVGLAASIGAGISMGFTEAASDDGTISGRGSPTKRGIASGVMTAVGGLGHALPYLIPRFWTATIIAMAVVFVELWAIAWVQNRYMETPFWRAALQVVVGGSLVFASGILIGSA